MSEESWVPEFPGQRPPFGPDNPGRPFGPDNPGKPFEPGNSGRPPSHGVYSPGQYGVLSAEIELRLAERSPAFAEADEDARRVLADQLARCELAKRWLDEHGLVDERGVPWPLVAEAVKLEKAAVVLLRELGMTTVSRMDLQLDQLHGQKELLGLLEVQEAIGAALQLAVSFVPRKRQAAYLQATRELLGGGGPERRRARGRRRPG